MLKFHWHWTEGDDAHTQQLQNPSQVSKPAKKTAAVAKSVPKTHLLPAFRHPRHPWNSTFLWSWGCKSKPFLCTSLPNSVHQRWFNCSSPIRNDGIKFATPECHDTGEMYPALQFSKLQQSCPGHVQKQSFKQLRVAVPEFEDYRAFQVSEQILQHIISEGISEQEFLNWS